MLSSASYILFGTPSKHNAQQDPQNLSKTENQQEVIDITLVETGAEVVSARDKAVKRHKQPECIENEEHRIPFSSDTKRPKSANTINGIVKNHGQTTTILKPFSHLSPPPPRPMMIRWLYGAVRGAMERPSQYRWGECTVTLNVDSFQCINSRSSCGGAVSSRDVVHNANEESNGCAAHQNNQIPAPTIDRDGPPHLHFPPHTWGEVRDEVPPLPKQPGIGPLSGGGAASRSRSVVTRTATASPPRSVTTPHQDGDEQLLLSRVWCCGRVLWWRYVMDHSSHDKLVEQSCGSENADDHLYWASRPTTTTTTTTNTARLADEGDESDGASLHAERLDYGVRKHSSFSQRGGGRLLVVMTDNTAAVACIIPLNMSGEDQRDKDEEILFYPEEAAHPQPSRHVVPNMSMPPTNYSSFAHHSCRFADDDWSAKYVSFHGRLVLGDAEPHLVRQFDAHRFPILRELLLSHAFFPSSFSSSSSSCSPLSPVSLNFRSRTVLSGKASSSAASYMNYHKRQRADTESLQPVKPREEGAGWRKGDVARYVPSVEGADGTSVGPSSFHNPPAEKAEEPLVWLPGAGAAVPLSRLPHLLDEIGIVSSMPSAALPPSLSPHTLLFSPVAPDAGVSTDDGTTSSLFHVGDVPDNVSEGISPPKALDYTLFSDSTVSPSSRDRYCSGNCRLQGSIPPPHRTGGGELPLRHPRPATASRFPLFCLIGSITELADSNIQLFHQLSAIQLYLWSKHEKGKRIRENEFRHTLGVVN